jgi:cytoskeletal protein RodZ
MNRRLPRIHERSAAERAMRRAIRARDAGLRRITAITRGMVAAAVALCGLLAVLAANGFHGHTLVPRTDSLSLPPTVNSTRTRGSSRAKTAAAHSATPLRSGGSVTHTTAAATTAPSTPAGTATSTPASTQTTPAQTTPAQTTPAQTTPAQTTPAQTTAPAPSSPSLSQPSQAPAPTPAAPVVVSGGS